MWSESYGGSDRVKKVSTRYSGGSSFERGRGIRAEEEGIEESKDYVWL